MGKFEKGQFVRVLHTDYPEVIKIGDVVSVVGADDEGADLAANGFYDGLYFYDNEIEPWVPKVGERVRFVKDNPNGGSTYGKKGDVVEVTGFNCFGSGPYGKQVEINYPSCDFRPDAPVSALEPFTTELLAILTVEAGKFYMTSDGRKVGPMIPLITDYFCEKVGNGQSWKVDGSVNGRVGNPSPIIAEWVDEPKASSDTGSVASLIGKTVTVKIAQPKFKVGDIVKRSNGSIPHRQMRITKVVNDNNYTVEWLDGGFGSTRDWQAYELELVTAPTPTAIVCLIENGQPKPSLRPHIHADEAKAGKEAARLASVYKGKEFGVFVLTSSTSQPAPVYKHEWQRLAANGNKISAIKELRAANDLTLKGAKDAVEHWLETAA